MCGSGPSKPTTKTITITISATTAAPSPLIINDGTSVGSTNDDDQKLVTWVNPGDTITFKTSGDITGITAIQIKDGSDLFSTDPTSSNNWTGVIGAKSTNIESYTIVYNVRGYTDSFSQDPKLQMNS